MAGGNGEQFRARQGLEPVSDEERNFRLDYYVCRLSMAASQQLSEALLDLRKTAKNLQPPELSRQALKPFKQEEFSSAVKEIVCIWIHQEAMDQGAEELPAWLRTFFRLSFGAADFMIAKPTAWEVMHAYGRCQDMVSLCMEACCRVCDELGFGRAAVTFGGVVMPIVLQTAGFRHKTLQEALTLPIAELRRQAQP